MNITGIIDSAKSGLQAAQAGMLVTSQNVNGSSVEGYVRRSADIRISGLAANSIDLTGTSFAVEGFTRHFSSLLQKQLLTQIGRTAYTAELTRATAGIDGMLINPDTSIASAMGSFFNAAGSLASEPENIAFQQSLIGNARQVVVRVRTLAEAVDSVRSDARQGMADVLNQANTLASQLAAVNVRIESGQVPGVSYAAADLLDERDRLLAQLHEQVGGNSIFNEDGTASFEIGGLMLVDRGVANRFVNQGGSALVTSDKEVVALDPPGTVRYDKVLDGLRLQVRVGLAGVEPVSKEIALTQPASHVGNNSANTIVAPYRTIFSDGKAGAYAQLLTDFVPMMQRGLNLLAATLVAEVNDVVPAGKNIFGLESSLGPVTDPGNVRTLAGYSATLDTFAKVLDAADPDSASNVYQSSVNKKLLDDGVSASRLVVVANNSSAQFAGMTAANAQALEALRDQFIDPLTTLTTRPATVIGGWSQDNQMNEALQKSLQDQKNAISGVNLDEEAANLVKFQQLYNASSKLIQTGQQMFDMLLAMLSGR